MTETEEREGHLMALGSESRSNRVGPVGPAVIVIYGAAGDLTKRKLIPALYNLKSSGMLPEEFAIVGVSRTEMDHEAFRARISADLERFSTAPVDDEVWKGLRDKIYYLRGSFDDPEMYSELAKLLDRVDVEHQTGGNYVHYLSTSPSWFSELVLQLDRVGLTREEGGRWRRVIIEKPFGHDLESARDLNRKIGSVLPESQVYRIDHYLGKETVQNFLVFRFANGLFEPVWNRRYISRVQMTVAESVGVEQRGGYYDTAGALRDMVPNHILQVLALIAMEPPTSFDAEAVREEKAKLLRSIQPLSPEKVLTETVRGQYSEGVVNGERLAAYRSEDRVSPNSNTETYAAMKLLIDNFRWAGVPFYLRTGKRMERRVSEIAIHFKRPPLLLFRDTPIDSLSPNLLILRIQPEEGISFHFSAKVPGQTVALGNVAMDFRYAEHFGSTPNTGYETLLFDCMKGDATLFQRADMVEAGWNLVAPVLDVWSALPARGFPNYAAGSFGPEAADELLARDGCAWHTPGI